MKKRIERQHFNINEYDLKAAWLSLLHSEGWKLAQVHGDRYEFESCDKDEWSYQVDLKRDGVQTDDYIQLYTDSGWEYVTKHRGWFYFRKKKSEAAEENYSIFSDYESKSEMCKRIIRSYSVYVIPLVCIFFLYAFILFGTSILNVSGMWNVVTIVIFAALLVTICSYTAKLYRIYKQMK